MYTSTWINFNNLSSRSVYRLVSWYLLVVLSFFVLSFTSLRIFNLLLLLKYIFNTFWHKVYKPKKTYHNFKQGGTVVFNKQLCYISTGFLLLLSLYHFSKISSISAPSHTFHFASSFSLWFGGFRVESCCAH